MKNSGGWISSEASRRAKSAIAVALSFVILLGSMGLVGWKGWSLYMDWRQTDDYIGDGDQPTTISIPSGATLGMIADLCVAHDVVRNAGVFEDAQAEYKEEHPESGDFQPGTFNVKTKLPAATAVAMLHDLSNKVILKITIPEGLRWTAITPILIDKGSLTQDELDQAFAQVQQDPTSIGLNAAAGDNPEGFLFPDTYFVDTPVTALGVMSQMATGFNTVSASIQLDAKAALLGISTQQAVTIASIIEAEVFKPDDRPKVARVIFNRLAANMPLQMDSTVNYGLGRSGHANLEEGNTTTDTPWNTYMHTGLPPTPINNPGKAALEAAVNPADGQWLYYTTVNLTTGDTMFENTWEEHEADVAIYQQWCQANKDVCQ